MPSAATYWEITIYPDRYRAVEKYVRQANNKDPIVGYTGVEEFGTVASLPEDMKNGGYECSATTMHGGFSVQTWTKK